MSYETRTVGFVVVPEGEAIFIERATRVSISDEGGGEFVSACQESGELRIDPDEWPAIRDAVDKAVKECRS